MEIFKIYLQAWRETFQHWKMWGLLYVLNVLFALLIILPFKSHFEAGLGNSLALEKLLKDFDFDILMDFLHTYGTGILPSLTPLIFLAYLLLQAFSMGGILTTFQTENFQFALFWGNGSRYFWRMLRLAIYFLIVQVVLIAISFILVSSFAKGFSTDLLQSEVRIIKSLFGVGTPYVFLAALVFMLHDYIKIQVVHSASTWLSRPSLQAIGFAMRHFLKTYPLYLLNMLVAFGGYALYKSIEMQLFASSAGKIFALFLLGQIFILFRIGARLVVLASANRFFETQKSSKTP